MNYGSLIERLRSEGNFRQTPPDTAEIGLTDFSSNDYLGLSERQDLYEKFWNDPVHRQLPMTASASRLLAAHQREHIALEQLLAELYGGRREALIFNSGYHANTGLIQAFADRDTLIVSDRLVHASILDGIHLSRAQHLRFGHNDYNALTRILMSRGSDFSHIIVVVESIYSMDGDRADMEYLTDLRRHYDNMLLYVDEAHAFGVEGPGGLGLSAELGDKASLVDIIVGTFGKAAASTGAFAVMSPLLRDVAVNRARSLIFSTALSPAIMAWTRMMVETLTGMDTERSLVKTLSKRLAAGLASLPGARKDGVASHIYPLIIGDASQTVRLSGHLRDIGLKVLPIRTPTVPAGTERLRISLSAAHNSREIDRLVNALISSNV